MSIESRLRNPDRDLHIFLAHNCHPGIIFHHHLQQSRCLFCVLDLQFTLSPSFPFFFCFFFLDYSLFLMEHVFHWDAKKEGMFCKNSSNSVPKTLFPICCLWLSPAHPVHLSLSAYFVSMDLVSLHLLCAFIVFSTFPGQHYIIYLSI